MSVDFYEEDDVAYRKRVVQSTTQRARGLAGILLRFGLVKNKRGAQFILITFSIVVLVLSAILLFKGEEYSTPLNPEILEIRAELELEGYTGNDLLIAIAERI